MVIEHDLYRLLLQLRENPSEIQTSSDDSPIGRISLSSSFSKYLKIIKNTALVSTPSSSKRNLSFGLIPGG